MGKGHFPGTKHYFSSEVVRQQALRNIAKKLNFDSRNLNLVEQHIIPTVLSHTGLLIEWLSQNNDLSANISNFLSGKTKVMIIGGVPGNGKSLLATEIRKITEIYTHLDVSLSFPLVFIPWDKAHDIFYKQLSNKAGFVIEPPSGESPNEVIKMVSSVMRDTVSFMQQWHPDSRIIVEVPLYGGRGDEIVKGLAHRGTPFSILVMHSEPMFHEIIQKGKRDVETSGKPEAMLSIRRKIVQNMAGDYKIATKKQGGILKNFWNVYTHWYEGSVIEWDPNANRDAFEKTNKDFILNDAKPDDLSPIPLENYISRQYDSIFDLMTKEKFKAFVDAVLH